MNEIITCKSTIIEILNDNTFLVYTKQLNKEVEVLLSKKIKNTYNPALKVGDEVLIQVSPYDLERGIIARDTFK